ncbi:hypothetical protein V501_04553 [Pseudogymnoascus sp. VKM F-4519 (FW-2642)]|nr:hypothetical protein V501_04553 [Pseudogymnoascus sp. VKM F-4519 (FW-2642)]
MMLTSLRSCGSAAALMFCLHVHLVLGASMKVTSFDGPVTKEELDSFSTYIATLQPAKDNVGNSWAQGHSGEETKAMGVVYQISGQQPVLDKMLSYCDAVLSERNDIAAKPVGQHKIWTGDIAPVWPNDPSTKVIITGGEQGDPVGHLASCANLILGNKALYNQAVTIGDKNHYGKTYLERAKTYLTQADKSMSGHILPRLLDLSNGNKMYFSKDSPYKGGQAVPWNQQMMFNYAFQNLVAAHTILGDNPALVSKYKSIMTANLKWFFTGGGSTIKKSKKGNPIYVWNYAMDQNNVEDSNHASLDINGFYRAYVDGNWAITAEQMKPFANVLIDVMTLGNSQYAGTTDGKCASGNGICTNYIRSGFLLVSEFRPDQYKAIMGADFKEGGTVGKVDLFSRFLLVKHRRATAKL